ncbi:MAG: DUF309 domain-containing protein [Anaerolineae bacterium]
MSELDHYPADTITAALSPHDPPARVACDRAPSPEMLHAFDQFNRGEYWEQHETLERVWRAESETSIRNFYKGIIQVGVGLYHLTRGNYPGVVKVLARGINYLKPYSPDCYGVDVARLIDEASRVYRHALAVGPERLEEIALDSLPKIQLIPPKHI